MRENLPLLLLLTACNSGLVLHDVIGRAPEVEILLPDVTAPVYAGEAVRFVATVDDAEDGPQELWLIWNSDADGELDNSYADINGVTEFNYLGLSPGEHIVTLTAKDSDGNRTTDAIGIEVQAGENPNPTQTTGTTGTGTGTGSTTGTTATGTGTTSGTTGTGTGTTGTATTGTGTTATSACAPPVIWSRVTHAHGAIDFIDVAFAPSGDYALLLAYPADLYRYDAVTQAVDFIDSAAGEYWKEVSFSAAGDYALVAGGDDLSAPSPVLWHYEDGLGITSVNVTGVAGGPLSSMKLTSLQAHPTTEQWVILGDNAAAWPGNIACLNTLDADFLTGTHVWNAYGCVNIDQGSESVSWASNLGQPVALAVSHYLELMYFDPNLAAGQFSIQATPNTGNLRKVMSNPVNDSVAWVFSWSGNKVYTWESVLRNDPANSFDFNGYTLWDMASTNDGVWKIFVGRNGNAWVSDSPWRPIDGTAFTNTPIPSFDQPPWSGTSNDYLVGVDFRPGTCEGLAVGDATSNQGTIALFTL